MSTAFNRTTLERRLDVPAPSFDPAEWLLDPDLTGVAGVPDEYWKTVGDTVVEMTAGEKTAKDAELLDVVRKTTLARLGVIVETYVAEHYDDGAQKSLLALLEDARNSTPALPNRAAYIQGSLDWVKSVLTYYVGKGGEIFAAPTFSDVEAVIWDFPAMFDGTDPGVTIPGALSIPD